MRPSDFEALQNADANLAGMRLVFNRHPCLAALFAQQPHLFADGNAIRFTLLLQYLDFLSVTLDEVNLDYALACFLTRTPANTLGGVVSLCFVLFEGNKLTIDHLRFFFNSENRENLFGFTYLLGRLCQADCVTIETIDQIFFALTNIVLLNEAHQIDLLFYQHFPYQHFKKYWEVMLSVLAIAPACSTLLLATLQKFKNQNELTEENLDRFFAGIKCFIDEKNPTKEMMLWELGSLFQQVFNLFYWCHDAALSKKILDKRWVVDVLFMTGVRASQFVAMPPSSHQYYFDAIEQATFYREVFPNKNTMVFNLNSLCDFLRKYLDNFSEEIIAVLNFPAQNEMVDFYAILEKAEQLGFLNKDTFNDYLHVLLDADFLAQFEALFDVIARGGVTCVDVPQLFWTILLDLRFMDSRVLNLLENIFDFFDEINAFSFERLISISQSFQIDTETTKEDFVQQLEIELQEINGFFIDGIDEDLANTIYTGRSEFYKLCRAGLSFSAFVALEPELQNQLLSKSSGYANAILLLYERNLFILAEIIELYRHDVSVCDALMCAPEQAEYQTLARQTLEYHRAAEVAWNAQRNLSRYQNQSAFLVGGQSVVARAATQQQNDSFATARLDRFDR